MDPGARNQIVDVGYMAGGEFFEWKADLFAALEVIRGKEQMVNNQRQPETVWRFTFDFWDVAGIDETFALRFEGNLLDIKAVRPRFKRRNETEVEGVAYAPIETGGGDDGQGQPGGDTPPSTGGGSGEYD